jgi:hypothetical protein
MKSCLRNLLKVNKVKMRETVEKKKEGQDELVLNLTYSLQ